MAEFLTGILAFPTVMFTVMLGLTVAYWLFVVVGLFSIDSLDGLLGLEAADGALDAAADATIEGAVEGAGGAGSPDGILGILNTFGLRGIPITVTLSFMLLTCWVQSFVLMRLCGPWIQSTAMRIVLALAVTLVSFTGSLFAASVMVRPLKRFFAFDEAPGRASLVGKLCTLTTGRVDGNFGQAEIADGGSGFVAEVRCDTANRLRRGDQALVFRYDAADEVFHIAPLDDALNQGVR